MLVAVGDDGLIAVDVIQGGVGQEPVPANGAEGRLDTRIADGAAAPQPVDQAVVEPLGFVVLRTGQANFTSRSIGTGLATMSRTGQCTLTASTSSW